MMRGNKNVKQFLITTIEKENKSLNYYSGII